MLDPHDLRARGQLSLPPSPGFRTADLPNPRQIYYYQPLRLLNVDDRKAWVA